MTARSATASNIRSLWPNGRTCGAGLCRSLPADGGLRDHVGRDLHDRLTHFACEDQPCIARDVRQHRVEFQLAVGVGPYDAALAQLLDEAAEQGLVEEFRRALLVQQRQPLRRELAQV